MRKFILLLTVYQCIGTCFPDNLQIVESVTTSRNSLLSFSYNKKCFNEFICSFNNEILIHESFLRPPFFYSKPILNFMTIFSFFFQYSRIKQDKKFRNIVENMFKYQRMMINRVLNPLNKFVYDPETFEDHLMKLRYEISNILDDKNNKIVTVEERNGRIIITQNTLSTDYQFRLIEVRLRESFRDNFNVNFLDAFHEFFTRKYEMYLQGLLGDSCMNKQRMLEDEYVKRLTENPDISKTKTPINELLDLFLKIDQSKSSKNDKLYIDSRNRIEFYREKFRIMYNEYNKIFTRNYVSGTLPDYLFRLVPKTRVKILYGLSQNFNNKNTFDCYFDGYLPNMLALKNMLESSLKNGIIISYLNNLSDESIESLVKRCLEITI